MLVENTRIRRAIQQRPCGWRSWSARWSIRYRSTAGTALRWLVSSAWTAPPCCGVNTTSDEGRELAAQVVFMAAIQAALAEAELEVPVVGV